MVSEAQVLAPTIPTEPPEVLALKVVGPKAKPPVWKLRPLPEAVPLTVHVAVLNTDPVSLVEVAIVKIKLKALFCVMA